MLSDSVSTVLYILNKFATDYDTLWHSVFIFGVLLNPICVHWYGKNCISQTLFGTCVRLFSVRLPTARIGDQQMLIQVDGIIRFQIDDKTMKINKQDFAN